MSPVNARGHECRNAAVGRAPRWRAFRRQLAAALALCGACALPASAAGFAQETASQSPAGAASTTLAPQDNGQPPDSAGQEPRQAVPGDELVVYLMTIGPGPAIWESFGHNAIWIRDQAAGTDIAYNYGMFRFDEPGFIPRLMRGSMRYWMEGFDGPASARYYANANRTVTLQELNLTPSERAALRDFLVWNERPENRFYDYDYYRDNCSTRVRDALDRALGGTLRTMLQGVPTDATYRSHTQRLTAHALGAYTGLMLALGQPVDQPISAWEEGFIPMKLAEHLRSVQLGGPDGRSVPLVLSETVMYESTRAPPPETAPERLALYVVLGLLIAGLILWLGLRAPDSGSAAIGFATVGGLWMAAIGLFGLIIALLWALTGHVVTYANENLLQVNPLALALAVLIPFIAAGVDRLVFPARILALVVAAAAILGLMLQLLPGFDQSNGEIIALVLPTHLVLVWVLSRWTRGPVSPRVDAYGDRWRERAARASGRYR